MGTTAAVSRVVKLKQKEVKWCLLQKEERSPMEGKPPGFTPVIPWVPAAQLRTPVHAWVALTALSLPAALSG